MQYNIDTGTFQVVMESADINAIVGESARIEVGEAINYIRSGQAEIGEAVQQGIASFDSNAIQKTNTYNTNAGNRLSEYNSNADNKLEAYNNNASAKVGAYDQNASDKTDAFNSNASDKTTSFNNNATAKTGDFNDNATSKTTAFNNNATSKTEAFDLNASNKTTDFNDNYTAKKALIDVQVGVAEGAATTATNQAGLAKQWAIGEPTEPTGGSAKHWAQEAESSLSGLSSRVSNIECLIPNTASPSNQLTDENFVNSSIATNTANFIGTFANVTALNAYSGTVTNNDYAFVTNSVVTDNGNDWATFNDLKAYNKSLLTDFDYAWVINGANFDLYRFDIVNQVWAQRATNIQKSSVTLNSAFNRYKATVNGSTTWNYEYTLNNSSFTAAQWAAINSSITSEKVALITPFTGADGTNAGTTGLVTAPSATDNGKFLKGDGTWDLPTAQAAFANITGQPTDNTNLANALNAKQDVATAVNYDNISNCITEIPQDIKLELNNGTLTLKAGSKVYVPNGSGVFNEKTISSDISINNLTYNTTYLLFTTTDTTFLFAEYVADCSSGTTQPSGTWKTWYDTTNNKVKRFGNTEGTVIYEGSLPIAVITVSNGAISSIDQVFNGFGYIGSTVFALPGVKGLIPNGRNADGTLKNIEVTIPSVKLWTNNGYTFNSFYVGIRTNGNIGVSNYSYDEVNNFTTENVCRAAIVSGTSGRIDSLTPKTAFHAVDYNDFDNLTINVLKAIYPVGAVYIGTTSTCPLASFFGTWTLKSSGRVLQGADSGHSAGTTIEAGLPNITGSITNSSVSGESYAWRMTGNGVFYEDDITGRQSKATTQGSQTNVGVKFDASRSSSIYGNSTTVQPPAYVVNIWERTA